MPTEILMPALSPTMEEGTLAKWLKSEGDEVNSGDVIAEIETDKATMEVEAVDEGTLAKIIVGEGTQGVKVNEPIAILLSEDEDDSSLKSYKVSSPGKTDDKSSAASEVKDTASQVEKHTDNKVQKAPASNGKSSRIFASPLARRLAEQNNIDLSAIKGSGPRGRIVKSDIEQGKGHKPSVSQAADKASAATPAASSAVSQTRRFVDKLGMNYTAQENSSVRKVIASRLLEAKQTIPHFYLTIECRIDTLLKARSEINNSANGDFKLSVNDFIVKACANALHAYPAANVSWTDDVILQYEDADVSVAVATDQGLITPIVKQAQNKGLRDISSEIKDLATRARDGKLKPEEFQGGTFTVSNLGMYGIKEFSAIINPPQSCILAVGAGEQRPYVEDGEIKIGTFMSCTLSTDHRSVDGAVGAEFLQIFKQFIENPVSMLL
jgi:pyruvate dehydrogenase E2 component (dihydrolipoamide acetyltransferase)